MRIRIVKSDSLISLFGNLKNIRYSPSFQGRGITEFTLYGGVS